jgi:hypothetical protein
MAPAGVRARTAALAAAVQVAFWTAYAVVKPTNFGGVDEWMIAHLASRGIVTFPYANRPLALLWALPAQWLAPGSFAGYRWIGGFYIALTGMLVFWLCRRLAPRDASVAVVASALTMLWAPGDLMRLSTVQGTIHLGFACGAAIGVTLFVESWHRRSPVLLALAAAAALATVSSYEAVLPLVAAAPLLLPWRSGAGRKWSLVWVGVMAGATALVLAPRAGVSHAYQATLGLDLRPLAILARVVKQYWIHLTPLATVLPPPAMSAVVPTLTVMAAVLAAAGEAEDGVLLRRLAAAGALAAGLAYLPYAVAAGIQGAMRTEVLSAPGIGLLLSATLALATRRLGRARRWIAALCAGWAVFLGASHMAAMQRTVWDRYGKLPVQRSSLVQLVAAVPDVEPHTLIVLVGETREAWPFSFSFRHAVGCLYEDRAAGIVAGAEEGGPYRTRLGPDGIAVTPWPEIQKPWREPATVYGYHEVIVVALTAGRLGVLGEWPPSLPALPAGAAYRPFARIVAQERPVAWRAALRE